MAENKRPWQGIRPLGVVGYLWIGQVGGMYCAVHFPWWKVGILCTDCADYIMIWIHLVTEKHSMKIPVVKVTYAFCDFPSFLLYYSKENVFSIVSVAKHELYAYIHADKPISHEHPWKLHFLLSFSCYLLKLLHWALVNSLFQPFCAGKALYTGLIRVCLLLIFFIRVGDGNNYAV